MLTLVADLTPVSAVCLAVTVFGVSLVPFFLLVDCDFAPLLRRAALSAVGLLLLLTPKGDR